MTAMTETSVDLEHVARLLRVLGASGFVNRFNLFLDETLIALEAVEAALPRGDRESIAAAASTLRGAAATVGATQLVSLADDLLARSAGDLSEAPTLLAQLHAAAQDAQRELVQVLN